MPCTYEITTCYSNPVADDYCASIVPLVKPIKTGECLVFDGSSTGKTITFPEKDGCIDNLNCGCVTEFRYINCLGVQDYYITGCIDEENIEDLGYETFERCDCPTGTLCVSNVTINESFTVNTSELRNDLDYECFVDFITSGAKEVRYVRRDANGNITCDEWRPILVSGKKFKKYYNGDGLARIQLTFTFNEKKQSITIC